MENTYKREELIQNNSSKIYIQLRQIRKLMVLLFLIITYLLILTPFYLIFKIAPGFTAKVFLTPIYRFFCFLFTKNINLKINQINQLGDQLPKGDLIIANHQSYLDYFILSYLLKGSFISTMEVKAMPILGLIAQMSGCIFIERRNKENTSKEVSEVYKAQLNQINVIIFPEAKATDSSELIRFRRPFFEPTIKLKKPIFMVCNNFQSINQQKINLSNKNKVLWYRQSKFIKHLWSLFALNEVKLNSILSIINYEDYKNSNLHLADYSHMEMKKHHRPLNQ